MILETGDYIAHTDNEITIVWKRGHKLYVFNDIGLLIDTIRNPDIEDLDDVDYAAIDYLKEYYKQARAV